MSGQVQGGFNGAIRHRMSPGLQRRLAEEEAAEARETARLEREREQRAEVLEAEAFRAAVADAVARGEDIDYVRALHGKGIGHQPHEFIALVSAQQDAEDQRVAFQEQAGFSVGRFSEANRCRLI
jgi:hypothetical protein